MGVDWNPHTWRISQCPHINYSQDASNCTMLIYSEPSQLQPRKVLNCTLLYSSAVHCVHQVDTHIHHSACMHQKHLLRFIKSKLRKEPDEVVIFRDGKYLTLREVFESLQMTGYVPMTSNFVSIE